MEFHYSSRDPRFGLFRMVLISLGPRQVHLRLPYLFGAESHQAEDTDFVLTRGWCQ